MVTLGGRVGQGGMYRANAVGRDLDFEVRHCSGVSIINAIRYVRMNNIDSDK